MSKTAAACLILSDYIAVASTAPPSDRGLIAAQRQCRQHLSSTRQREQPILRFRGAPVCCTAAGRFQQLATASVAADSHNPVAFRATEMVPSRSNPN